jgi:hypothetical protein
MTDTVPEVFADVADVRDRTLYERIHSILVITGRRTAFAAMSPNDLTQFVNSISAHMPGTGPRYMLSELEDGLRAVHYALCEGAAMFRLNYCSIK